MKENNRATGSRYEKKAMIYLEQQGYKIITSNYRCKKGEIDIIAKDGECLVFCEVKYRTDERKGNPLEAVEMKKQQTISNCALYYLMEQKIADNISCRFDVIGILGDEMFLIKDAFMFIG
ncbi:MAG: YraN family protein [Lachnospiraceae bacterium]|nr:YraN family protein [Lachnospiraceae bacterium]